jgi:alginate O-acetyltransferase complex protein AlgI
LTSPFATDALLAVLRAPVTYLILWSAFTAVTLFAFFRVPKTWRMNLLAGASAAFLALAIKPLLVVFFLAFCCTLHAICLTPERAGKPNARWGGALIVLVLIPFSLSRAYLEHDGAVLVGSSTIAAVLMVRFVRRSIFLVWEVSNGRVVTLSLAQLVVYLLGLPFIAGRSPAFAASELFGQQVDRPLLRTGLRTSASAIGHGVVLVLLGVVLPALAIDLSAIAHADRWTVLGSWLVLDVIYVRLYLHRIFEEHLAIGLARLFGFQLRDNYQNPLASRSYAELWRRWNIHFRDLLVGMFYYPVLFRLHRRRPEARFRNVALAVATTYLGHLLFLIHSHSITLPASSPQLQYEMVVGLVIYDCLQATAVVITLFAPQRLPTWLRGRHVLGAALGVFCTFHLRAALLPLFRSAQPWRLDEIATLLGRAFGF